MTETLQAVVGHVLVVGGRAVRMPPPGALAESAPRRAPRVREDDVFFVLVTPCGESRVPAAFFEGLAQDGADVYFGSSGGITGGLREALLAIHQRALGEQPVNVLALVLRGSDLYAARSGRAFGVLWQEDALSFFPAERRDPLVMNLPPLGTGAEPDIQLGRYTVTPGQVMLLADEGLIEKGNETWKFVLSRDDLAGVIDALKGVAGQHVAASAIRFLASGEFDPGGVVPQPSVRAPQTDFVRDSGPAVAPLPSPAEPAVPDMPAADSPPVRSPVQAAVRAAVQAESDIPASPESTPFTLDEGAAAPADSAEPFVAGTALSGEIVADDAYDAEAVEDAAGSRLAGLFGRRRGAEGEFESAPQEAPAPPRHRGPSPLARFSARTKQTGRDAVRSVLAGVLGVMTFFSNLFESILPAPEEDKSGIPTNLAIGLVVLIPLVIVIGVVGLALSEQGKTDYEVILERAQTKHQEALTLSGTSCDNHALRPLWVEVLNLAQQAGQYRPNDTNVLLIEADAKNYLDCFDGVDRRDLSLLNTFESNADLAGPIVNGGVDLFVLDRANDAVYHDTLNETGNGLTSRGGDPILWRGYSQDTAAGLLVVEDLIDIAWLESGGTVHNNVLIALDRNGALWAYSPTFFTTAQQLITTGWQNPVAIAVFRGWLYVLDTEANQVWRYMAPAGENAYSTAPEEYFNGAELPDLSQAVDIDISDEGAVYILLRDGTVKKYRRNIQGYVEEQPFYYKEVPPGALTSGKALFIDNDPASTSLYIVDHEGGTIYRTSWSGRYNRGVRPQNVPDAFIGLSGIYADAVVRNNMYVVAGNKLYHFYRNMP